MCCAKCGYDLHGATSSHCPECGHHNDPEFEREAAVAWFCSRRGLSLAAPPPLFIHHLGDPRCRRTTKRRLFVWFILPWLGLTAYLNGLTSFVVVHTVERIAPGLDGPFLVPSDKPLSADHFIITCRPFVESSAPLPNGGKLLRTEFEFTAPRLQTNASLVALSPFLVILISQRLTTATFSRLVRSVKTVPERPGIEVSPFGYAPCSWFAVLNLIIIALLAVGFTLEERLPDLPPLGVPRPHSCISC